MMAAVLVLVSRSRTALCHQGVAGRMGSLPISCFEIPESDRNSHIVPQQSPWLLKRSKTWLDLVCFPTPRSRDELTYQVRLPKTPVLSLTLHHISLHHIPIVAGTVAEQ